MGEINLDEGVGKVGEKLKIYYSTLMLAFSDLRCGYVTLGKLRASWRLQVENIEDVDTPVHLHSTTMQAHRGGCGRSDVIQSQRTESRARKR